LFLVREHFARGVAGDMKKIINDPNAFVDEALDGILAAHPTMLMAVSEDRRAIARADAPIKGHVGIVTGGGSGHLPLFLGYVGVGLCTAVAVGNVFSSPSPEQILAATRAADGGAGILYLYGNYGGDVMNFDLAGELTAGEIETDTVVGIDDVASAPAERSTDRRGVAGLFFAYKCAGAAAERGLPLGEVAAVARSAVASTRSMGVGLSPTILPAAGKPTFEIGPDEMEIGIGIHGERGVRRGRLETADQIGADLLQKTAADLSLTRRDEVAVLVNGLGATPLEELYVLYRHVRRNLDGMGVVVRRTYVGEYATSLEMAGASLSIMRLDDNLARLLEAPARSPFFRE
jgi:dihydroxyacetone kinase